MANNAPRNRSYNINQAAHILGVSSARVSRYVRQGTIRSEVRRGRVVVTEHEISRLLDGTDPNENLGSEAVFDQNLLDGLARFRDVPTDVLMHVVDNGCTDPLDDEDPPNGNDDAEVARLTCAHCYTPFACLELGFRLEGPHSLGVWGGLAEQERRELFPVWAADRTDEQTGGEWA